MGSTYLGRPCKPWLRKTLKAAATMVRPSTWTIFLCFGECSKKNQNAPSEHAPVRGCQNKRLGGTIGYYYDKGVYNM